MRLFHLSCCSQASLSTTGFIPATRHDGDYIAVVGLFSCGLLCLQQDPPLDACVESMLNPIVQPCCKLTIPNSQLKMDFDRFAEDYEHEVEEATNFARLPRGFFLEIKVAHLLDKLKRGIRGCSPTAGVGRRLRSRFN